MIRYSTVAFLIQKVTFLIQKVTFLIQKVTFLIQKWRSLFKKGGFYPKVIKVRAMTKKEVDEWNRLAARRDRVEVGHVAPRPEHQIGRLN